MLYTSRAKLAPVGLVAPADGLVEQGLGGGDHLGQHRGRPPPRPGGAGDHAAAGHRGQAGHRQQGQAAHGRSLGPSSQATRP
jgi:hypothetical protein